jgi:hypothetical protein
VRRAAVESSISVEVPAGADQVAQVEAVLQECGLVLSDLRAEPAREGRVLLTMTVRGNAHQHDEARLALLRSTGSYRLSINE